MNRPRPAYLEDRIAYRRARASARKTHPQPCECGYCISRERADELWAAKLARQRAETGEAPF